ncbi:MAG: cytochrome c-type biogenesis CcmF C-terminal domain-containing protein [Chloroflexota bacterium]|nr:cytochrome c-type biogenesis CcmF C-terminal domain-containing protein [Chloroflexota bacterium]
MLSEIGSILIGLALFTTFYAIFALVYGLRNNDHSWRESGQRALYSGSALLLLALILLLVAFITDQFQFIYVATHSNSVLPLALKMSAIWAGQEGSLLLWAFLQLLFTSLIARKIEEDRTAVTTWATVILAVITAFFVAMTLVFSNPFLATTSAPLDGQGMNPLLRHPGMIFHPPVLYIGYVGLAIPFAYALAALIVGDADLWPRKSRRWLLIAWLFLGLGLFLGMRWAYDVLGWGGYWGWDAVENAGLMPWLTATALMHGLVMQSRGKGFKVWNVSLAVLSYALVIFGTFTTRSGLIQSVHAFSESTSGPYYLALIALILLGSIILMVVKRLAFANPVALDKIFSREGMFFFALLSLLLITVSILVGTLLPTLTGGTFTAPAAWFNRVVGPQLGVLVFLIGVCPLFGRVYKSVRTSLWRGLPPLIGIMLGLVLAWVGGFRSPAAMIGLAAAGFAGGTALGEIGFDIGTRISKHGFKPALGRLPLMGEGGYGGPLVHLGVVLMAVGVIGTQMYATEQSVTALPGDSVSSGDYTLIYEDLYQESTEDHFDTWASVAVYKDSDYLTTLTPRMAYYPNYDQTIAEPAISSRMDEDLYLLLFRYDETGEISLSVRVNPLSGFLWAGGFVLLIGGLFAWWPRLRTEAEGATVGRRRWMRVLPLLILTVLVILGIALWGVSGAGGRASGRPLTGENAPGFSASDLTGVEFSLEDYRGQVVVLNFWATWCPQCKDEMPEFEIIWQALQTEGVQFLGVAMDDTQSAVEAMARELGITYPLIVEEGGRITGAYGVSAVPETFIIAPDGSLAAFHIGVVDGETLRDEILTLLEME